MILSRRQDICHDVHPGPTCDVRYEPLRRITGRHRQVFVGVESGHPERRRAWRDEWHCGEQLRKLCVEEGQMNACAESVSQ